MFQEPAYSLHTRHSEKRECSPAHHPCSSGLGLLLLDVWGGSERQGAVIYSHGMLGPQACPEEDPQVACWVQKQASREGPR